MTQFKNVSLSHFEKKDEGGGDRMNSKSSFSKVVKGLALG